MKLACLEYREKVWKIKIREADILTEIQTQSLEHETKSLVKIFQQAFANCTNILSTQLPDNFFSFSENTCNSVWNKKSTRCHLVLYLFLLYKLLNMFRATLCPSSGADDLVVFFH